MHETHAVAPAAGWVEPAAQLSQLGEAADAAKVPGEHARHEVASALVLPEGQLPQLVAPELVWYWPEAQLVHAAEPCANEMVPARQAAQLDAPEEAWYEPAPHRVQ